MKITGLVEVEAVIDVTCDVCGCSTRGAAGGYQYGTLQAHWRVAVDAELEWLARTPGSYLPYYSANTDRVANRVGRRPRRTDRIRGKRPHLPQALSGALDQPISKTHTANLHAALSNLV